MPPTRCVLRCPPRSKPTVQAGTSFLPGGPQQGSGQLAEDSRPQARLLVSLSSRGWCWPGPPGPAASGPRSCPRLAWLPRTLQPPRLRWTLGPGPHSPRGSTLPLSPSLGLISSCHPPSCSPKYWQSARITGTGCPSKWEAEGELRWTAPTTSAEGGGVPGHSNRAIGDCLVEKVTSCRNPEGGER